VVSLFRENGWVCVEVADSGQGIASDYLPKLFDMFSQAEGGARRDHGGLGIGLSLVKQLAEMHGGRVEARSERLGKGACFRLWLPALVGYRSNRRASSPFFGCGSPRLRYYRRLIRFGLLDDSSAQRELTVGH
jgi:K+-sensing histidine kinase KdpD